MNEGTTRDRTSAMIAAFCAGVRAVLLRPLGLGGDLEVWLAPVPPGREGRMRYEAEPHAAFLALIGDDGLGEDDLAGQGKFAEEGASEDRHPLERAWWPRLVICACSGDMCRPTRRQSSRVAPIYRHGWGVVAVQ